MPQIFTESDDKKIFNLFLQIMDRHEIGDLGKIPVSVICTYVANLIAKGDSPALREILDQKESLDLLVFRITKMPAKTNKDNRL